MSLLPDPTKQSNNYLSAAAVELFKCVWPLCEIKSQRVKSYNHCNIYVKPTWWIYIYLSLQHHCCSGQVFNPDLNESSE